MKENDQEPIGIPGSFIDWKEVYVPYIPFSIYRPNKTMKRNIDPETFVDTDVESNIPRNIFDCLWNSVENLPMDHNSASPLKTIPQYNTEDGSVSFAFKTDGRWFKINIRPMK